MRSLNAKLLLIVIGFVMLSGVLGAIRVGYSESQRIEAQYDARLKALSSRYSRYLEDELSGRLHALQAASDVLLAQLDIPLSNYEPLTGARGDDGAYRQWDEYSGAFVYRPQTLDASTRHLLQASHQVWEQTSPIMASLFSAFYFISDNGISRVWPKSIIDAHRPNHDVTREIFYTIAAPDNNPDKSPEWTPIYFDTYTDKWMTSLVIPIYRQGDFIGVVGGDIDVGFLLDKLRALDADNDQIQAFLFNREGEVVLHSSQRPGSPAQAKSMNEAYPLLNKKQQPLEVDSRYIDDVIKQSLSLGQVTRRQIKSAEVNIVTTRLEEMDWYISFYYPQQLVQESFRASMVSVYSNILMLALFLFVVLYFSIRFFVVRRIARLADATSAIGGSNRKLSLPDMGDDEIGRLSNAINNMLDQIRHLIRGLDDKIVLLDKAGAESRQLMSAIENSVSLVVILDRDWEILYANSQYWQVTGYRQDRPSKEQNPLLLGENRSITPELIRAKLRDKLLRGADTEEAARWQAEYLATTATGREFWLMQSVTAILGPHQEPEYYVCVGQDISDLKEKQQEVEKLAYYDHLTGLANRTLFKKQLSSHLNHCLRTNTKLALFYIDLDHFKRINDTFGHESGDQLLVSVARKLRDNLREEDCVARLGGDEFAVLLGEVESPQYAYIVASKLIRALNAPIDLQGKEVVAGGSIGITLAPDDSDDLDVLMKNADLAMYKAKDQGRNAFQFYTTDMNIAVERRLAIEREIRQALRFGQFVLYYQPFVDFSSGKIVGAEALLRWNHPERGLVSPGEFIPVAEESGLIVPLGRWVLKTACFQARAIQKALQRDFTVSVNISARQLSEPDFLQLLEACLRESGLAPSSLELEVTESTLMEDVSRVIPMLEQLRQKGCGLAIDDFGTGYSSLSYLKRLPINSLKVDRSFVQDLPDDEEDKAITSLVVAMAKSLHYKVIVEGVESPEQHAFLTTCGCHLGQGYFYSRPVPLDQFMRLVQADARMSQ
ncbi:EAL domain-containing protein [Gilvimarinus xylanilyticus]|uniref:cyclic-guanylate-specific phosphodiesterase n=1 Tax=Gilvimarinus xylanilyticus TaxID=2944139 RepID=A0A9X2HWM7_9GAMM|nr:EAL domain-containing protein [Gilvimarinus xylanilyticus]MCP8898389.1 EAL domain-containing protein [Gilvimarinus xylanilyticus]